MIQFDTACEEMPPQSVATAVGPPSSETICWTVFGVWLVASMSNCNHTYAQIASMLTAEPATMPGMNETYGERVKRLREAKELSIAEAARLLRGTTKRRPMPQSWTTTAPRATSTRTPAKRAPLTPTSCRRQHTRRRSHKSLPRAACATL